MAWAQTAPPSTAPLPPAGRLLASNCFQCHGTNGNPMVAGFDRLAGKSSGDLFKELKELQNKTDPNEIMKVHALGYTDAQLRLIADYFSRQPR
ncbi:c-type cytochrome [Polaromonas sp.]|uniref:c-type cytochrome n=1 Tax=Polaromonas sp. TaxID=1869339 RepID=UPI00286CA2CE|nr:c-type cytochrome [Polaromonas sp.]